MRGEAAERLAAARATLGEGTTGELGQRALVTLGELDAESAVAELHELASSTNATRDGLAFAATMIERLSRRRGVVTETDLVTFFESGSNDVRRAAASALEARGDDSLVHALLGEHVEVLAGDDDSLRLEAARQVSELRSPLATQAVLSLLSDENEQARRLAIRSLARDPRDVDVIEQLKPLLDDSSERVRRDAARASAAMERAQRASERRPKPVPSAR